MNVILDGGPLHEARYRTAGLGDSLERTVHAEHNDESYVLARYVKTSRTVDVVVEHETREGVVLKPGTAQVYEFDGLRYVLKSDPRTRQAPAEGEQMALAM